MNEEKKRAKATLSFRKARYGCFLSLKRSFSAVMLKWSGKRDSNPRPSAWEADALPTELLPQITIAFSDLQM